MMHYENVCLTQQEAPCKCSMPCRSLRVPSTRVMWRVLLVLLLAFVRISSAAETEHASHCKATSFSQPGFVSSRSAFPQSSRLWNGVNKVSFQNKDGTWLAGNFRDTGSDFVVAMLGGATAHKENWPLPDLAKTLADVHGLSSISVDVAGRGESCGYEIGPDCTSAVRLRRVSSVLMPCNNCYSQAVASLVGS